MSPSIVSDHAFTLDARASWRDVAASVEEHGLAHVPSYLSGHTLERLVAECTAVLDDDAPWVHPEAYSLGKSVRLVTQEIDPVRYPTIRAVFRSAELEKLTEAHYGPGYVFAEQIYAILDVVGSKTVVQELHYDKIQHLKIFIYLSDVGLGEGPFHCVPGSHTHNAGLQAANRAAGVIPTDADTRVLPAEFQHQVVPVTGPAGTLIVFDSDIAHHAGVPLAGSRLAVRSLNFGPRSLGRRL